MTWSLGLEDRGVMVTGATGGIGRAVAHAFAAAGARVALVDLDADACAAVAAELEQPERHRWYAADLAAVSEHAALVAAVRHGLGRLDVLAHLAAVLRRRTTVDEVTEEDWDVQIDTNLKATFFLNRAVAAALRSQGYGGRIINFTSQGWWTGGFGGSVVYAASKGGIVSLSRGLARSWAADGITVNTVAPGAADTAMMRSQPNLEEFVSMIPLGRMAEPDELTGAVLFLASDHARYITGATLNVTGGQIMY